MTNRSKFLKALSSSSRKVARNRGLWALIAVLIVGAVFPGTSSKSKLGAFFTWDYHRDMLRENSIYGILACGMTIVILTAGIDLSVGSVLGMTGMLFAHLMINMRLSPLIGIPVTLLVGTAAGLLNGAVITTFKIQPFVATLAMMVSARGLAKFIGGGAKIQAGTQPLPPIFQQIASQILNNNLAIVTIIFLLLVVTFWVALNRTRFGRHLFAIGGNEEAARLSGIRVNLVKATAYAISGLMSAIAGVCYAGRTYYGDPEAGAQAYELTAIAMVVIGGTSLMGGRGGILLTLLGALIIGYIEKILSINGVVIAYRFMIKGAIIVAAVIIQQTGRRSRIS
jgi:ribose transport system permease protein